MLTFFNLFFPVFSSIKAWDASKGEGSPKNSDNKPAATLTKDSENYFNQHAKSLLIAAIKMLLNKKDSAAILYLLSEDSTTGISSSRASISQNSAAKYSTTTSALQNSAWSSASTIKTLKILKIVSNLVERQEIGHAIIDEILLDLLFYVYKECNSLITFGGVSVNYFKKFQSHMGGSGMTSSSMSQQPNQQHLKELSDLKKATCNFLFQSFQVYFIWDFCAKKFEAACKSCANVTMASSMQPVYGQDSGVTSPGQLCDLYEFILDLLTNAVSFKAFIGIRIC